MMSTQAQWINLLFVLLATAEGLQAPLKTASGEVPWKTSFQGVTIEGDAKIVVVEVCCGGHNMETEVKIDEQICGIIPPGKRRGSYNLTCDVPLIGSKIQLTTAGGSPPPLFKKIEAYPYTPSMSGSTSCTQAQTLGSSTCALAFDGKDNTTSDPRPVRGCYYGITSKF